MSGIKKKMTNKKIIAGLNHQSGNLNGSTRILKPMTKKQQEETWERFKVEFKDYHIMIGDNDYFETDVCKKNIKQEIFAFH